MRKIIHVDMDSFYAAIEERDNPRLIGKPLAVGGKPGRRGVIATANYIARKFGVHSAMASTKALQLCPQLIIIQPNMNKYKKASYKINEIFRQYTDLIEPLSLDEAFLDVTSIKYCYGSATLMAQEIRKKIYSTQKLTASAGISINKFVAKVATSWHKPNGQYTVPPDNVFDFVEKLKVEQIFGVGEKTAAKLHDLGITTCCELRKLQQHHLAQHFGPKLSEHLFNLCRGIDDRPVLANRERKSLSVEHTFAYDLSTMSQYQVALQKLIIELTNRIEHAEKQIDLEFNKVFIKIKFYDFTHTSIEKTIVNSPFKITNEIKEIFTDLLTNAILRDFQKNDQYKAIRLLGIGIRFKKTQTTPLKNEQLCLW